MHLRKYIRNFNSIKVQLKLLMQVLVQVFLKNFNSIKVQLKLPIGTRSDHYF